MKQAKYYIRLELNYYIKIIVFIYVGSVCVRWLKSSLTHRKNINNQAGDATVRVTKPTRIKLPHESSRSKQTTQT